MIRILTDSMSDITQLEAARLGIEVLPLVVRFGNEEYLDGLGVTNEEFYERLQKVTQLPKTSQIIPSRFQDAFDRNLKDGDDIVYIGGSSKLSGTFQSSVLARSMCTDPERVYLVDSRSAAIGEAQLVYAAVKMREQGMSAADMAEALTALRERVRLVGMADQLKYLVMGGRLNGVVGAIGTTLNIKPMLRMEGGLLHQAGLCRSMTRVHRWYVDAINAGSPDPDYPLIVAGAYCPKLTDALHEALDKAGIPVAETRDIGAVIGTYTGPGLTAVSWIAKE